MDHRCQFGALDRRNFLTVVGVGLLASLGACSTGGSGAARPTGATEPEPPETTSTAPPPALP
ncbi:MAG: hypothetical protein M3137_04815, partial [Actinomycetota bacterium]|nr:hypothetical protein [Actinomycetota bacterium]